MCTSKSMIIRRNVILFRYPATLKAVNTACWLNYVRQCVFDAFLEGYVDQTGRLVVMSNSLPQREDELLCGLHGWVVCVCVVLCAYMCQESLKLVFLSFHSDH